jgi:hypothetical protein
MLMLVVLVGVPLVAFAACASEAVVAEVEITRVVTEMVSEEGEVVEVTRVATEEPLAIPEPGAGGAAQGAGGAGSQIVLPPERMIIKDGTMAITVLDTGVAAETAVRRTQEFGGYVVNQRIWDGADGLR